MSNRLAGSKQNKECNSRVSAFVSAMAYTMKASSARIAMKAFIPLSNRYFSTSRQYHPEPPCSHTYRSRQCSSNEQGILRTFFIRPPSGAWLSRSEQTPRDPSIGLRAGTKVALITFQVAAAANRTITMAPNVC